MLNSKTLLHGVELACNNRSKNTILKPKSDTKVTIYFIYIMPRLDTFSALA